MANEEYEEYEVFTDTSSKGETLEFAVVDNFEVEGNAYVAAAMIEGDEIKEDGLFLYKRVEKEDHSEIVRIENEEEYAKVAEVFAQFEEE